jgi:flagellar biosynthesis/type III secretory pathway protein FliH
VTRRFRPVILEESAVPSAADGMADEEALRRGAEADRAAQLAAELRRAREDGHRAGYTEGWNQAASDVRARLEAPLAELVETLRIRLAEIDAVLTGVTPDIARMIVRHAIDLAEAVVSLPSAFDRIGLARHLVAEAAAENRGRRRMVCLAHPDTIATLEQDLRQAGCVSEPCPDMILGGIVLRIADLDLGRDVAEWDASVARQVGLLRKLIAEDNLAHGA